MAQMAKGGAPFSLAAGAQVAGEVTIAKVVHIPIAAGDTFLLQDGNGKTVLQGKAQGVGAQPYDFPIPVSVKDLGCAQLTASNVVWVYPA